jgi:predicted MPP superfamily phosphohydrolase
VLAGVDDVGSHRRAGGSIEQAFDRALDGRPAGATILLSHGPFAFEAAARAGVGLMLSGHTHGGQIWPFDLLAARLYPVLEGRAEIDGMTVLVCRGTGTWGPRMRLWSPSEILRITLRAR